MRQGNTYSWYETQSGVYRCLMCDNNKGCLFVCQTVDTVSALTTDLLVLALALSGCNEGNFSTHPLLCSVLFQCSHKNINEGKIYSTNTKLRCKSWCSWKLDKQCALFPTRRSLPIDDAPATSSGWIKQPSLTQIASAAERRGLEHLACHSSWRTESTPTFIARKAVDGKTRTNHLEAKADPQF